MARQKARSHVVWIRQLLLAVGILGVASLVVMLAAYLFGKSGLDTGDTPATAATDAGAITAGQQFDFMHTIEGRRVFRIRADKSLQDRRETVHLETVIVDIFREDGETYRVTSNNARVNENTWQARLQGDVVVSGWGELELEARALDLQNGGQVLLSRGAVRFRFPPDLEGRATNLRLDRRTDTISLSGGVHIRNAAGSELPVRLDCERLVYRRGEGMARALDEVFIRHGGQELSARALTIFLHDDQESLRSLRARWNVVGAVRTETDFGGEMRMEFRGDLLQLDTSSDDPTSREIRLEGETDPASVKVVDADGLGRTLSAEVLESETVAGKPVSIKGQGRPMLIDEFLDLEPPYPLRQLCAKRGRALFLADGSLGQIFLVDRVELWNRDFYLSGGSQAVLDIDTGKIEIEGKSVELFSERGDLAAPRITYSREKGLIRAAPGVRASLESGYATAFEKTPFGHGRGPIRVEATEALFSEDPAAFTFLGQVSAWRDRNILHAEQLRGDQATREMSASGGVRTLWFSAPKTNGRPNGPDQAIEVTSKFLTYRQIDGTIIYSGDVKIEQARRTITCRELSVALDTAGGEAERMVCREDVRLVDLESGRRVFGDSAVYSVAEERVEIYGDSVRLIDSQNNRLEGRYLLYDLDAGTVQIQSRSPSARARPGSFSSAEQ